MKILCFLERFCGEKDIADGEEVGEIELDFDFRALTREVPKALLI